MAERQDQDRPWARLLRRIRQEMLLVHGHTEPRAGTTARRAITRSSASSLSEARSIHRPDQGPEGCGEPDGPDKRQARQDGEIHAGPFWLRQVAPAGLDELILVHIMHPRRRDG